MGALEFTAALIGALAWPLAVVVVAITFRRAIQSALSGQIRRWKAGPTGLEVESWEQTVIEAGEQLGQAAPPPALQPRTRCCLTS
jgi:hypothetical protein